MSTAYQREFLKALSDTGVPFIVLCEHSAAHNGMLLWARYGTELFDAWDEVRPRWEAADAAAARSSDRPSPPPDLLVEQPDGNTLHSRIRPSWQVPPPEGSIYIITSEIDPAVPFEEVFDRSTATDIGGLWLRKPAEDDLARIRSRQAV